MNDREFLELVAEECAAHGVLSDIQLARLDSMAKIFSKKTNFQKVQEFHKEVVGLNSLPKKPTILTLQDEELRVRLHREEQEEFEDAILDGDIVEAADALADLLYVVYGSADYMGIDIDEVFAEVHRSNMSKKGGKRRADGKQLKPDTYTPPDVEGVLRKQSWLPKDKDRVGEVQMRESE